MMRAWMLAMILLAGCVGAPAADLPDSLPERDARTGQPAAGPAPADAPGPGASPAGGIPADVVRKPPQREAAAPEPYPHPGAPVWRPDGSLQVDVPLDVVLVGFPAGTAAALQSELDAWEHQSDNLLSHPQFPADGTIATRAYTYQAQPLVQRVVPRVLEVDAAQAQAFHATVPVVDGLRDARATERLALELARDAGAIASPDLPPLVILHQGRDAAGYRMTYENGWLDGVRFFGGSEPVIVADVSAPMDRWVGDRQAYDLPVATDDLESLAFLVEDAAHYRAVHGGLYPPPLAPCHAVTVLYAVRASGTTGLWSPITAAQALDAARIRARFEELTGDVVHVDVVTKTLPVDDPALDAMLRNVGVAMLLPVSQGVADPVELVRGWVERNWESYHVPHDGCEEYVSLVVFGDYLDDTDFGIAMHAADRSRRFSFSMASEWARAYAEAGPVGGIVYGSRPAHMGQYDLVTFLVTHETGHLFGLAHPHNHIDADNRRIVWSFSPGLTPMSYQTFDRTTDFGAIDRANWARNRVGFLFAALHEAGARDHPAAKAALEAVDRHAWRDAYELGLAALPE
ncbi:MAG TPA: hypothetical protein VFH47_00320 [Candidatus Thermoplasmatota archaeon]|nr:hypothetical protein [Candidatus Thermoplasmatota archaeon]